LITNLRFLTGTMVRERLRTCRGKTTCSKLTLCPLYPTPPPTVLTVTTLPFVCDTQRVQRITDRNIETKLSSAKLEGSALGGAINIPHNNIVLDTHQSFILYRPYRYGHRGVCHRVLIVPRCCSKVMVKYHACFRFHHHFRAATRACFRTELVTGARVCWMEYLYKLDVVNLNKIQSPLSVRTLPSMRKRTHTHTHDL
jgi:hypothetical protein